MTDEERLEQTAVKAFRKHWETGALSDYDIRAAENVMNDITGRKDRNYHYGIL